MGSIARVNVWYERVAAVLATAQVPVYGALLQGESIYEIAALHEGILMIGNEVQGHTRAAVAIYTISGYHTAVLACRIVECSCGNRYFTITFHSILKIRISLIYTEIAQFLMYPLYSVTNSAPQYLPQISYLLAKGVVVCEFDWK